MRCASSSSCRRTGTSGWPATIACASSARRPTRASAPSWCATCCAPSARRRSARPSRRAPWLPRDPRPLRIAAPMNDAVEFAPGLWLRGIVPPLRLADFGLAAFDMDSTLISIECVDEIADHAGRKAEVAAITEAAMRGEIADYKESLRRRVALLKGVPESALLAVYTQRLQLNPGVQRFVGACKAAGLHTLLVS